MEEGINKQLKKYLKKNTHHTEFDVIIRARVSVLVVETVM